MAAEANQGEAFRLLIAAIVAGDVAAALAMIADSPRLALERARHQAIGNQSKQYFFDRIGHYIYEGDSALHMAAAACQTDIVKELVNRQADVRARNRRGAEPLHYAVDAGPGLPDWDPGAQTKTIALLIRSGADPNAVDKSGVAPLHRAIRNRTAAAVNALLDGGANPKKPNGRGSTPLFLAMKNTGKSGSGSSAAKAQRQMILKILSEPIGQ